MVEAVGLQNLVPDEVTWLGLASRLAGWPAGWLAGWLGLGDLVIHAHVETASVLSLAIVCCFNVISHFTLLSPAPTQPATKTRLSAAFMPWYLMNCACQCRREVLFGYMTALSPCMLPNAPHPLHGLRLCGVLLVAACGDAWPVKRVSGGCVQVGHTVRHRDVRSIGISARDARSDLRRF